MAFLRNSIALLLLIAVVVSKHESIRATPLDDYVNKPDPYTGYQLVKTYESDAYTGYILNFTSQKWYDESVSNRPIWFHYLSVVIPKVLKRADMGFLLISGGANRPTVPDEKSLEEISVAAVTCGAIFTNIGQIPNQPITFAKDPAQISRTEDEIIAFTWKLFIENPNDPEILLRMPMTKAVVRAMDAIQDFALKTTGVHIEKFIVGGASKRGWTSWTTAAVDNKRVVGAVPIVMDLLSMNNNMHHSYKSLGGWTFAYKPYFELNITTYLDTPEFFQMERIIDPASYLDRYVDTKLLVINCAGDEFFLPDDSDYYWNDMATATNGTILKRLIPNADHYFKGHEWSILLSMTSFFMSIHDQVPLPIVRWTRPNNRTHGVIKVTVDITNGHPKPSDVRVFSAKTATSTRRDFRLFILNPADPSKPLPNLVPWMATINGIVKTETDSSIMYEIAYPKPLSGWVGFFFQLSFPGVDGAEAIVTSETNIIPETFPFEDCYREGCQGVLV